MAPRSAHVASLLKRYTSDQAGNFAAMSTTSILPIHRRLASSIASRQSLRQLASSGRPTTLPALLHRQRQPWNRPPQKLQNLQHQQIRRLHILVAIETTVDTTVSLISEVHTISHTPWWLTIPLVALGVNTLFRLPFSVQSRLLAQKQARLAPVLRAWAAVHAGDARKTSRGPGTLTESNQPNPAPAFLEQISATRIKRTVKTVAKTFGVQTWRLYGTMLMVPPWLVVIEALRRLCGAPIGLLGLVFRRVSDPETSQVDAAINMSSNATAISSSDSSLVAVASSSFADPSLATGGAFWFSDLTLSDPYYILPVALSTMLVVNMFPLTDAEMRAVFGLKRARIGLPPPSLGRVALQRTLLLLSISVGFFTQHFPSAIHLYWLSSSMSTFAISRALNAKIPLPKAEATASRHMDLWIQPPEKP